MLSAGGHPFLSTDSAVVKSFEADRKNRLAFLSLVYANFDTQAHNINVGGSLRSIRIRKGVPGDAQLLPNRQRLALFTLIPLTLYKSRKVRQMARIWQSAFSTSFLLSGGSGTY
jgi:hypothetical protein